MREAIRNKKRWCTLWAMVIAAGCAAETGSDPEEHESAELAQGQGGFIRGDANTDGSVDISDAIFVNAYLFQGGPAPQCADAADANDDGAVDISDSIYILNYLYGGAVPKEPFPEAGWDPTDDDAFTCGDLCGRPASGRVLYVDAAQTKWQRDGASWSTAYRDLHLALAAAVAGDEIWVAGGTYRPDPTPPSDQFASFELKDGVALYGGFHPGDACREDRDLAVPSVLSGDYGSYDPEAIHVVKGIGVGTGTVVDGFRVERGDAWVSQYMPIRYGRWGGGMLLVDSGPKLANLTFAYNRAASVGGAIAAVHSSPTITSCTFRANAATVGGGAIWLYDRSSLTIVDSTFDANNNYNSGNGGGAAIYASDGTTLLVVNGTFTGNLVRDYGAAIVTDYATSTIVNSLFSNNVTSLYDGGALRSFGKSVRIVNSTFAFNRAGRRGGAVDGPASLEGCVLWGNVAPQVGAELTVRASCADGALPGNVLLTSSPFVSATDYRLADGSSCIDRGDASLLPADSVDLDGDGDVAERIPLDRAGMPRVVGTAVDAGAYEHP